jgi:hypothetical protein
MSWPGGGASLGLAAPQARPSAARFWPTLLVLIFMLTTLASFRVRQSEDLWGRGGFDWQVKYQAASWVALGILAFGLLLSGRADLGLLRRGALRWYCWFALVALVSSVLAPSPLLTAFRAVQLGVAIVLVISWGRHLGRLYALLSVYLLLNWIVFALGALGIGTQLEWIRPPHELFEFHSGSRDDAWRFGTAFGHPSQISVVAAALGVGLAARARGRLWLTLGPVIAWCLVTNLMTVSRTGIAGMLVGFLVVAWDRRKLLPLMITCGIVLPLALWSDGAQDSVVRYIVRGQTDKDFSSLSGRDTVFVEGWRRVVDSAFVGEGFATARVRALAKNWGASHAHNLFLQAATSLGLPGLILATLVVATFLRDVWRLRRRQKDSDATDGREFVAMAAPLLIFCLMDSGFASAIDPFVVMFIILAARLRQLLDQTEPERADEPALRSPLIPVRSADGHAPLWPRGSSP